MRSYVIIQNIVLRYLEVVMTELEQLRADTLIASKYWGRMYGGLLATTCHEMGEAEYLETYFQTLRAHQGSLYLDGLKKLGIREEEPPAVKAAKFHYFSNIIGGLEMEYIEESPKKCWIRYPAPQWTFPGIAMLAMPAHTRRTRTRAWHPRNGQLMGCDRLQWVCTKSMMEGDSSDEGYFIEHDHAVPTDQTALFKVEIRTPEFDPAKAPKLDPNLWPEARILKARSRYSGAYTSRVINVIMTKYGVETAAHIIGQAMRGLAIQYIKELKTDMGIEGRDLPSVVAVLTRFLTACRQEFDVKSVSATKTQIVLNTYKPFDWEVPEKIRDAYFEYQRMAVRILNGRVKLSRSTAPEFGPVETETWELEDTGRWLW